MMASEQRILNDPTIRRLWAEIQLADQERMLREIAKDPAKHKLTRIMTEKGTGYSFWPAGKDGRGREVRFCYASWRNAAGYFLTWREVVGKKQTKRDMWAARKVRRDASAFAHKRAKAFKSRAKAEG